MIDHNVLQVSSASDLELDLTQVDQNVVNGLHAVIRGVDREFYVNVHELVGDLYQLFLNVVGRQLIANVVERQHIMNGCVATAKFAGTIAGIYESATVNWPTVNNELWRPTIDCFLDKFGAFVKKLCQQLSIAGDPGNGLDDIKWYVTCNYVVTTWYMLARDVVGL